ncbi:MAG: hypothetical protein KY446_09830 [Proteobacteria bacterium]|nr:hypothetical protein [Pseudomonadota bacterium]
MQINRRSEAQHDERELRWLQENDLVRPYRSFLLTTRTQRHSYVQRLDAEVVLVDAA